MERRTNGAAVRAIREAVGIPQAELAARCGIAKPYMSQIESGARQPSSLVTRALATHLAVPLDAITYPWAGAEEFGDGGEREPAEATS